jgi:hypothetical protein
MSATRLDNRGFHVKNEATRELLETIGGTFLTGYGFAAEARDSAGAERRLETIPTRFRGFAYEGAAMGFAVRDTMALPGRSHVADLMAGRGADHIYMLYVGIGWAMARLPRLLWGRLTAPDPLLRWLALDGYGFHQAYFHTDRYVHGQYRARFPWPYDGPQWYVSRAIDQGIGRALWFVGGADTDRVARLIGGFAADRRADLYSGAGLAATYAGGADSGELERFWEHAGRYRPQVAQGSAFGAAARVRAGLVVPHNDVATRVFCGMPAIEAAKATDDVPSTRRATGHLPAYEAWRQRIAGEFSSLGRC